MQTHINTYLYLTLIKEQFGLSSYVINDTFRHIYGNWDDMYTQQTLRESNAPKAYHVTRRMKELGYSPTFIAQFQGISKQAVSQHLARTDVQEYINPFLRGLELHKLENSQSM